MKITVKIKNLKELNKLISYGHVNYSDKFSRIQYFDLFVTIDEEEGYSDVSWFTDGNFICLDDYVLLKEISDVKS